MPWEALAGLGPALVSLLEDERIPGVETESNFQLQMEDAAAVSNSDIVIFVDAARAGVRPYYFHILEPSTEVTITTHSMSPASVLALALELYRKSVRAYLLAIRGYEWDISEELTPEAARNLAAAHRFIREKISEFMNPGGEAVTN